ncbi:hypothetical protein [Aliivibrio finisterrensis]|uniref:Lipoprotein n=1 Tax=Aliivibrio finisterrensis TaxID=511998 RepID=A0ABY0I327_9GAMM|nr:hypothetical protein [Aliivibrio finisterrensis]RYU50046.1 hypothetical protein ERW56_15865 [Aliivibrio finisterrensis]RYU55747.1 hypothetical protein ERW50_15920 [Aliivibrio finisterrensis]RYU62201.1 hypothetical protein ERW53_16975 [Aliivibrio finisterrensis]RYU80938.1 hypothetical protein ERW55_15735 [Aliivibrio finisterrensis]RYU84449.1 hypothetical protein ERW52_10770 [Aliivibrio finisterrensis]
MKKLLMLSTSLLLLGCSSTNNSSSHDASFIPNSESSFTFGDPLKSVVQLNVDLVSNNKIQSTININMQRLPFRAKFDLCENTGKYKELKKVVIDKNGSETPFYENKKVNCNSEISISHDKNSGFIASYNLNFLSGFEVNTGVKGFENLLPYTVTRNVSNHVISDMAKNEQGHIILNLKI